MFSCRFDSPWQTGAVGLVFLIFTAILFWLCCQQANRKNLYTERGESASNDDEPTPPHDTQQPVNFSGSVPRLDQVMLIKKSSNIINRDLAFDFRSFSASGLSLAQYRPNTLPIKQVSLGWPVEDEKAVSRSSLFVFQLVPMKNNTPTLMISKYVYLIMHFLQHFQKRSTEEGLHDCFYSYRPSFIICIQVNSE